MPSNQEETIRVAHSSQASSIITSSETNSTESRVDEEIRIQELREEAQSQASLLEVQFNSADKLTKLNNHLAKLSKVDDIIHDVARIKESLMNLHAEVERSNRKLSRSVSDALVNLENARRIFEIELNGIIEFRKHVLQALQANGIEVSYFESGALPARTGHQDDVGVGVYLSLLIINLLLGMKSARMFAFSFFSSLLIVFLKLSLPNKTVGWVLTRGFLASLAFFALGMTFAFIKRKLVNKREDVIY